MQHFWRKDWKSCITYAMKKAIFQNKETDIDIDCLTEHNSREEDKITLIVSTVNNAKWQFLLKAKKFESSQT